MPDLDGLEFCASVRNAQIEDYVYFILITALRTDISDYDRAVQAGVDDFLVKPVAPGDIWRRLFVAERFIRHTAEIRDLHNLIPVCMQCKKVRDDAEYWRRLESYLEKHQGTVFANSVCPACQGQEQPTEAPLAEGI